MKDKIIISGYQITTDATFQNERYGVTPELQQQFETLQYESLDHKNEKIIDKLTKLIIQYPTVPILKNYLSVAHSIRGNFKKALDVNRWILSEHPDYLFALLNEASRLIDEGKAERIPELLGEHLEIKFLYPEREVFHLLEFTSFFKVAVRYFLAINQEELAENRLRMLREVAPNHSHTMEAEADLLVWRKSHNQKSNSTQEPAKLMNRAAHNIKTEPPSFHHQEVLKLYNNGLRIPPDILREILALPHKTLALDLEKMLEDTVKRYEYFTMLGWEEETHNFVVHALLLLREINAIESLPKVLSFLKHDYEFLDFWLGDHKTSTLWYCIYSLGFKNTETLKQFLLEPEIDTFSKTSVSEALCQITLHHPERRNEILQIYTEVFTAFVEAKYDDDFFDGDFLGLAIGDAIDCQFSELLPLIRELYHKQYVPIGMNGDLKAVERDFQKAPKFEYKRTLFNIFDLYSHILATWAGYKKADRKVNSPKAPQVASIKIGRNDLCPCGSGKKYKKCCL